MKRAILTAAVCVLLAPAIALAAGFTASLSGDAGSGLAVITINGTTIEYNILVSGLSSPSTATISDGQTTVDLAPTFVGGSAFGSVTSDDASDIAADPAGWTVTVGNGTSTLSGPLAGAAEAVVLYFPVAASIQGQAGTLFKTDGRFVNRTGGTATVTIDYYAESVAGHSAPTATQTTTILAGEQAVVDDAVNALFGITNGKGAMVVSSDRAISGDMRIYNDQTDAGLGTFGQFERGLPMSEAYSSGLLPFLSNQPSGSGAGFRANVGWFNPTGSAVSLTLRGWDSDGTLLGEITRTVNGFAQEQYNVATLWPALADYGDFYITYEASGAVFTYASVVDNVNGDAIYVPAAPLS